MPSPKRILPRIALKIDVLNSRAARAIPHLQDVLRRNRAGASFTCTPRSLNSLKWTAESSCEIGLMAAEPRPWWTKFGEETPQQGESRLRKVHADVVAAFASAPLLHATGSWSLTRHDLRLTQRLGFTHACDCRGRHPFVPVWDGEVIACPQFPITLPTLEELAGRRKADFSEVRTRLLALTEQAAPWGHVFSLRAPPQPEKLDDFLEELFSGWRDQGYEITSIQTLASPFDMNKLPRHEICIGTVPDCKTPLLVQGNEFLSEWRHAA